MVVGFTDHYGRLMGKRYDAELFVEETATHGTHGCDYLLTTDMEMEPVQGYTFANWEKGYGDVHLVPDLSTLRIASWLEKSALVLCDVHDEKTHEYVRVAPRSTPPRSGRRGAQAGIHAIRRFRARYYVFEQDYRAAAQGDIAASRPPAGISRTTTSSRAPARSPSRRRFVGISKRLVSRSKTRRASGASASTS